MSETLRYRISDISTDTCRQVSRPFITVTLLNVVGGFVAYSCPVVFTSHREQTRRTNFFRYIFGVNQDDLWECLNCVLEFRC
ncbi:hypothetical protein J6590_105982 [Homalodisca vitripennis]|nr:hypothetical protein J6590_105982 [Homalodisca vitripennis]